MITTHYRTLGLPPATEHDELKTRYRALTLKHHPDAGGDTERFKEITEAGSTLLDPDRRRHYDAVLRETLTVCAECDGRGVTFKYKGFTGRFAAPCRACKGVGYV